jgi:hypothetical protein
MDLIEKLKNSQFPKALKLNIGGTPFYTSLSTLGSIKGTYFEVMVSEKWKAQKLEDGSYFIDRDPTVFRFILNFLRDGEIDIESRSKEELKLILKEATFYQIQPLIKLLVSTPIESVVSVSLLQKQESTTQSPKFIPGNNYALSNNDKYATKVGKDTAWDCNVLGNIIVSSGIHLWNVKILKSKFSNIMIGVVPSDANVSQKDIYSKCGYFINAHNSKLFSGPPHNYNGTPFCNAGRLLDETIITIKLDFNERTISFIINETGYGVAYKDILDKEFQLCVIMNDTKDIVEQH